MLIFLLIACISESSVSDKDLSGQSYKNDTKILRRRRKKTLLSTHHPKTKSLKKSLGRENSFAVTLEEKKRGIFYNSPKTACTCERRRQSVTAKVQNDDKQKGIQRYVNGALAFPKLSLLYICSIHNSH